MYFTVKNKEKLSDLQKKVLQVAIEENSEIFILSSGLENELIDFSIVSNEKDLE